MLTKELILKSLIEDNEKKISELKISLEDLKESLNSETKSSMGDKYETGRSMIQSEMDKSSEQFSILKHQRNVLKSISLTGGNQTIDFGSLIYTDKGIYFLSIGLGQVKIEKESVFCISSNSPIGQVFLDKKEGEIVEFMKNKIKINSIK